MELVLTLVVIVALWGVVWLVKGRGVYDWPFKSRSISTRLLIAFLIFTPVAFILAALFCAIVRIGYIYAIPVGIGLMVFVAGFAFARRSHWGGYGE